MLYIVSKVYCTNKRKGFVVNMIPESKTIRYNKIGSVARFNGVDRYKLNNAIFNIVNREDVFVDKNRVVFRKREDAFKYKEILESIAIDGILVLGELGA